MTDHDQFRQIVSCDPKTRDKWIEVSNEVLATIENEYGVKLDREQLLASSAIKLNVLADAGMDWRKDVEALPEIAQAMEAQRLSAVLSDHDDPRHDDATAAVYAMKPEERLAAARNMSASPQRAVRGSTTKRTLTPEQKVNLLRELDRYPRSMRISKAREWGLE